MKVDSLTRAFIRGAALAVTLSACVEGGTVQKKLDPVPDRTYPDCVGPYHDDGFGYHGQCCGDVRCIETVAGLCPELMSQEVWDIEPPGSGTCRCDETEGPFAPHESDAGDCCYVVHAIGCDGRPLKRDGAVVTADVLVRGDWMGASELPAWSLS